MISLKGPAHEQRGCCKRHGGRGTDAVTYACTCIDRLVVVALFAVLLFLAGCSRESDPTSYTTEVQANYMENCVAGTNTKLSSADTTRYCECTYTAFVDNVGFDRFQEFENYLREHVGENINSRADFERDAMYGDIVRLLDGCVGQGPSAPKDARPPTTTVAATAR